MPHRSITSVSARMRVYLEILPGIAAWKALVARLKSAGGNQAKLVPLYAHNSQLAALAELPPGISQPVYLLDSAAVDALIERAEDGERLHLILPSLSCPELDAEPYETYRQVLSRLVQLPVEIDTTFAMVASDGINDVLKPVIDWPKHATVHAAVLRMLVTEYEVCDVPPQTLLNRYLNRAVGWPALQPEKRAEMLSLSNLHRLREMMFRLATAHASDAARLLHLHGNEPHKPLENNSMWDIRWLEMGGGLLLVGAVIGLMYTLFNASLVSGATAAIAMVGAILTVALSVNVLSALVVSVSGLVLYGAFMLTGKQDAVAVEAGVLAVVAALLVLAVYLRNQREAQLQVREEQSRALLRLVHDTSYLESRGEIVAAGVSIMRRALGGVVVYADLREREDGSLGQPDLTDGMELTATQERDLKTAIDTGNLVTPSLPDGYLWCPVHAGNHMLGVMGVRSTDGRRYEASYSMAVFLRAFTRLMAGAIWRVQLDNDRTEASFMASRESLRSSLLASVSHDLKTPLVSVIGSLSTLAFVKDGLPLEERQELIQSAYHEAERLHRIVHNVLEMAKLESGGVLPSKEPMDLGELAQFTAKRLTSTYPDLSVEVDNTASKLMAVGDELLVSQIVYNLLDNAAKYGPRQHNVVVNVSENTATNEVALAVTDEGAGVAEEDLSRIFDKFYRSGFTDRKPAGSGLGLAICKAIAEAHGGSVSASLRGDGKLGMVFTLRLPAVVHTASH